MTAIMKAKKLMMMMTKRTCWEKMRILEMSPVVMDVAVGLDALDVASVVGY